MPPPERRLIACGDAFEHLADKGRAVAGLPKGLHGYGRDDPTRVGLAEYITIAAAKNPKVLSNPGRKSAQLLTSSSDDWVTGSPPKRLV